MTAAHSQSLQDFDLSPLWTASFRRWARRLGLFGGLLLTLGTGSLLAQAPLSDDFQINETSPGFQIFPRIASGPDGFTVVWEETASAAIRMRSYSVTGIPLGPEIAVTGPGDAPRDNPSIAIAPNGSKLIVWTQTVPDGQVPFRAEVFGTLYDRDGEPVFSERRLNAYEPGDQSPSGVAADGDSNFIVVWVSAPVDTVPPQDGSGSGVYARRISSSGEFLGREFRVNTYTRGDQSPAGVAAAPDGKFVIVWTSMEQDGSAGGVYGQRFGANGKRIGSEFQVNQHTVDWQIAWDVAMDRWGNFVVVWESQFQFGPAYHVYARRYRSDGRPRGHEWRVTPEIGGSTESPRVAMDPAGNFVVVWEDSGSPSTFPGPGARAYRANGKPVGKEFGVNSEPFGFVENPDVALADDGTMMVVWQDNDHETPPDANNGTGVFGRRFVNPFP